MDYVILNNAHAFMTVYSNYSFLIDEYLPLSLYYSFIYFIHVLYHRVGRLYKDERDVPLTQYITNA